MAPWAWDGVRPAPLRAPGALVTVNAKALRHVGFSTKTAALLTAGSTPTFKDYLRAGLSPRQTRTLLRVKASGAPTLSALIHGGFTKHQAQLLLETL